MKSYENSKIPCLFQLMNEKNIKAAPITRDLGISSGNLSDWKSGKAFPTKGILVSLADYLDTTPEYLTGKTDEKRKTAGKPDGISNNEINALDDALDGLTAEELQQVRKYAEFLKQQRN